MWFSKTRDSIVQSIVASIGRYWQQARLDRRFSRTRLRRRQASFQYRYAMVERLETRALLATVEFQNFDGVSEPALPAGWVTVTSGTPWRTVTGTVDTAPNAAFVQDVGLVSDSGLVSPTFTAPSNAQILFRNRPVTQAGIDGGVFEISINGGAFTDITFIGGSFATGGYNAGLIAGTGNPLSGRLAWTGVFAGYVDTTANLPASAFGQPVQVRWRFGAGNGTAVGGWLIDTIRLVSNVNIADYGDAPAPYSTTLGENGAAHLAAGPRLGASRDVEANGTHSANASSDGADENGVTFGTVRVGDLSATATVNVASAPSGAKLSAWIDFNGDGNWGGPGEQIAANVAVVNGNNIVRFDVPSFAQDGQTFARFRLSTAGNLGPDGLAMDGEVEDYAVTITRPAVGGVFSGQNDQNNVITTAADGATGVFAADVDGDGDMDILSASQIDNKIAWYENKGSQNFTDHTITTVADFAHSVFAADVDGDGDLDVLSASRLGDYKIAWYENDGSPAVGEWPAHTISTADSAVSMFVADVDGDGDVDVLSASPHERIAWFENDGSPAVGAWTAHTISTAADGARSVFAADVDGDGDLDVLSASRYDNKIAWYENKGSQNFTPHTISTAANGAVSVFAADVDGDGNLDVLSASYSDDKIVWYENNGNQVFTARTISTAADGAQSVFAADVDGDGDLDVLSASAFDDKIAWYANDGSPAVGAWTAHTISTAADGARSVFAADVDGDGDLDVLSASVFDAKIAWYENGSIAPVITRFDTAITYTENAAALLLDTNAVVMDSDSANFATGKLTVQLISNGQSKDRLAIRNQGVAAGQIGVSGTNVTFGGIVIGTFAGGTGTTALVVTFNAKATPTRVQALLRNVTYRSVSENPSTAARTVRVKLTDGDGGTSNRPTKKINVVSVNDAPLISGFDTPVTYNAGSASLVLDTNAVVKDIDSANLATGKLTVQLINNGQSTDRLQIRNQGVGAGQFGISGANVTFGGILIGTFTGGTGTTALVVTFNANATPARVQTLLRNITYRNTSATPSTLARTVQVKLTDGDGGTSNLPTKLINVLS
jgi:phage terminase large subunit-like protein